MTLAHVAPHAALLAAGAVLTALVMREGHRGRHRPGHGHTRAHSRRVGTATQDRDAIKEHDMTCTTCGALIGADYTSDADGTYCINCVDHPNTPANGVRIYTTEGPTR